MSTEQGTIVVGIDASEQSMRALDWAVEQSVVEHRTLTLVHAVHVASPAYLDAAVVYQPDAETLLRREGQQVLDDALAEVARVAPDIEVDLVLRVADPRAVLLELSHDAAMVVLGSRGRGQLRSLLLGSVGAALVRHAHCPVVIHRPGKRGLVRNGVLVGIDATPESRTVLEFAYREASLRDLPMTILHCGWDQQSDALGAHLVAESFIDPESERLALAEAIAGMAREVPRRQDHHRGPARSPPGGAGASRRADEPDRRGRARPRVTPATGCSGRWRPRWWSTPTAPWPSSPAPEGPKPCAAAVPAPLPEVPGRPRSHQRNCETPKSRRNARTWCGAGRQPSTVTVARSG